MTWIFAIACILLYAGIAWAINLACNALHAYYRHKHQADQRRLRRMPDRIASLNKPSRFARPIA
jgi:hypothetical protein